MMEVFLKVFNSSEAAIRSLGVKILRKSQENICVGAFF